VGLSREQLGLPTKFHIDEGTGLTRNQFFIWLGKEAAPELPLFNELTVFVLDGRIDRSCFDRAVQAVVDETDALRTIVRRVDGLPRAEVLGRLSSPSSYLDLSAEENPDDALDRWARRHVDSTIDLSRRSFESTLLKLSPRTFAWALLQHHILSDATSMAIIFRRVGHCYERLVAGEQHGSPRNSRYTDYVAYETAYRQSERYGDCESYWQFKTAHRPDPVTFYGGRALTSEHGLRRERLDLQLGAQRSAAIRELARGDRVRFLSDDLSIFSIFAAALYVFLFRLSGQPTLAIGVPWQNRPRSFRETVGLLMEQDPFVVSLDEDDTFGSVIRKVHDEALDVMRHLPYAAGNPGGRVYDVSLNYVKVSLGTFAGLAVRPRWYRPIYGDGSMGIQVHDLGASGELSLSFDFNAELFAPSHRRAALAHFMNALQACLDDPSRQIGSVSLLSDGERDLLLGDWNATADEYPREQTVVQLFEAQVARRPLAPAARWNGETLAYAALDARSTALARRLRALGVVPGVLVGLCLERSLDMLVGLLGILKAGGAYVPLDPAFPAERLAFMLTDSGAPVLVSETRSLGTVEPGERQVVCLDALQLDDAAGREATPLEPRAAPEDLAYVLYTSGSTGKPKAVEIPHRALTNFLWAMRTAPGFAEDDVLLAITTLSFDIAGLELFLPLIVGGQVEVASRSVAADGRLLRARLEAGGISVLQATPATWRMLLDAGWSGTPGLKVLCGGEGLPQELAHRLLDRCGELWNMYGPTETTIWSSTERITADDAEITIGRPVANTEFYVVDTNLQPVPIGVPGELLIGGDGLARGYRNRPELTAAKFIPHPFDGTPSARVYRTGDLARHREDGRVVHLGRLDHQVKIRGFRIELGEIESLLDQHPSVHHSVVVAQNQHEASAYLAAYVVPEPGHETTASGLRRFLAESLPDYMVPSAVVTMDALPLSPNGKVDRKALPAPDHAPTGLEGVRVEPRTPTEQALADIWRSLLDLEQVGIHDNFFELGGQSLLALQMISRIHATLGIELSLHSLVEAATIESLSALLDQRSSAAVTPGSPPTAGPTRPTDSERKLVAIWESLFDVRPIGTRESFLDLQGDTDRLEDMMKETRRVFGVFAQGLSARAFLREPTIEALAATIDGSMGAGSPSLVVRLQPNGAGKPLFLVHAGGGYAFFYRALAARLDQTRPVYGIRAETAADGGGAPFTRAESIEAVAARYVAEVKSVQPEGPYTLGGACIGGVIAFEMAQQLQASDEEIAGPLLLFDSIAANNEYLDTEDLDVLRDWGIYRYDLGVAGLRQRFWRKLRGARQMGVIGGAASLGRAILRRASSSLRHVVASMLRTVRKAGSDSAGRPRRPVPSVTESLEIPELRHERLMAELLDAALRLAFAYRPRPFAGGLVIFDAAETGPCARSWRELATEGIVVCDWPGQHLDMLEDPSVAVTASLVDAFLRRGADAVAGSRSEDPPCPRPTSDPEQASAT
jgi:amino acid adenylation domain-containing protein